MSGHLVRSEKDWMIADVCGGLAEQLGADSTWVRVAFGVPVLFGGAGAVAYPSPVKTTAFGRG